MAGKILTTDAEIKDVLKSMKTVAVLGLSTDSSKASHRVAAYLVNKGVDVKPVRPDGAEVLGVKAETSVDKINIPVDVVDVFRKSQDIPPHADEVLAMNPTPKVFWMQLDIENQEAALKLTEAGIDVVMNKCIKIEYDRLIEEHD